ncbi:MAG: fibronectin type III domain-containing protein [Verrucomicrobiota bacterium]|nr:fibronectin type III domain-containing protein [Verrucomicrobiota bacterium]
MKWRSPGEARIFIPEINRAIRAVTVPSLIITFLAGFIFPYANAAVSARDLSVQLSARANTSNVSIELFWKAPETTAAGYRIFRKLKEENLWQETGHVTGTATNYIDKNVRIGSSYEYKVVREFTEPEPAGYGYIYAGLQAPLIEFRGKVLLVLEREIVKGLEFEIGRFEEDLIGDGWAVQRLEVGRTDSPPAIREKIKSIHYSGVTPLRTVILIGNVPVPYSGNITPDFHEDHRGAWPADLYYGTMDGTWTDSTVNSTRASRPANHNVPGDGRFDQDYPPAPVTLEIGRIDLSRLTCFKNKVPSLTERDLLRRYFQKNHAYRHQFFDVRQRALYRDPFGLAVGNDPGGSALRNFSPLFGFDNLDYVSISNYFPTLEKQSYAFTYSVGGGAYTMAGEIGTSDDFAYNDPKAVFTMFLGSYFGDWDNESNFMRACLGAKSHTLTCSYAGYPHHFYHHMGLGETIGYGLRLSQNNQAEGLYPPHRQGTGMVHISLQGDPTLRLHTLLPPQKLQAHVTGQTVNLVWNNNGELSGKFHVYRAESWQGPYTRLTPQPITPSHYSEIAPPGKSTYMVKAISLESVASGTYFNSSQGKFITITPSSNIPAPVADLTASSSSTAVTLRWNSRGSDLLQIERSIDGQLYFPIAHVPLSTGVFTDAQLEADTVYHYRTRIKTDAGDSNYSSPVTIRTASVDLLTVSAQATYIDEDRETGGQWKNVYGGKDSLFLEQMGKFPSICNLE